MIQDILDGHAPIKDCQISSAVYEFQITQSMPSKGNAAEQIFKTRQIWTFMGPLP